MYPELLHYFYIFCEPITFLGSASKRVFWLFLLSSTVIAAAYFFLASRHGPRARSRPIFTRSLWWNMSSWVDMQWLFLNHALKVLLLLPLIGSQLGFALWINNTAFQFFGPGDYLYWSPMVVSIVFTVTVFVIVDATRYLVHYAYHKVPLLWRFHAIHHSATSLTPLTLYRVHFIEMSINFLRGMLTIGTISGIFMYVFYGAISVIDIMGVNLFTFLFNIAGANLRHSPVWIGFGSFEKFFISPAQHQIHHSSACEHRNKNFGSCLAIWDQLFGTWLASKKQRVTGFGLPNSRRDSRLRQQLFGLKTD